MAIEQTTGTAALASSTSTAGAGLRGGGLSFRSLLSDLNPLQYIPVIGSIYRAVTGDEGNADLRFVASLGTSFAMGGPVGVGITVAEKITGVDPEKIGRHLLANLFHFGGTKPAASEPAVTSAPAIAAAGRPWTASELSAYGVRTGPDRELDAGTLGSADVLNSLELRRLQSTYA